MQVLNDWQVIKLNQIEVADSVVSSMLCFQLQSCLLFGLLRRQYAPWEPHSSRDLIQAQLILKPHTESKSLVSDLLKSTFVS